MAPLCIFIIHRICFLSNLTPISGCHAMEDSWDDVQKEITVLGKKKRLFHYRDINLTESTKYKWISTQTALIGSYQQHNSILCENWLDEKESSNCPLLRSLFALSSYHFKLLESTNIYYHLCTDSRHRYILCQNSSYDTIHLGATNAVGGYALFQRDWDPLFT